MVSQLLELFALGKTGIYKSTGKKFSKACTSFAVRLASLLKGVAQKNPQIDEWMKSKR